MQIQSFCGPQGPQGERGPLPVRGVDYWLEEDERAMQEVRDAAQTIESLRTGKADKVDPTDYIAPPTIGDGVLGEVLECALSYYRQGSRFVYGNGYTANNDAPGRMPYQIPAELRQYVEDLDGEPDTPQAGTTEGDEPTEGGEGVQDSEFVTVAQGAQDSSKTMRLQLDCSSFVYLVMSGVPFERSRYAGAEVTDNERTYAWGIDWKNRADYCENESTQNRILANGIARYCEDRGWTFAPKADASNLSAGDLVFFTPYNGSETANPDYYLGVTHVGIFMWTNGYGQSMIMDCSTSDAGRPVRVRVISTQYRKCIVRAARLPLTGSKLRAVSALSSGAPSVCGVRYENVNKSKLLPMRVTLKPSTFYTVGVKIRQDAAQHPQSIAFRPYGMYTAYDRITKPRIKTDDDYYESHFFVTLDGQIINRPDGRLPIDGAQGVDVYEYAYYQEGDTLPEGKQVGDYISGGCLQVNTAVEWGQICEGLHRLDHGARMETTQQRHTSEAVAQAQTGSIEAALDNDWTELDFALYAPRSASDSAYVGAFVGEATASSQRLAYFSCSSAKLVCRGTIRRVCDGTIYLCVGSTNASASSENSDTTTAFSRSIYTADEAKTLRFTISDGTFAAGTRLTVSYR